jgi:hypothetical protein
MELFHVVFIVERERERDGGGQREERERQNRGERKGKREGGKRERERTLVHWVNRDIWLSIIRDADDCGLLLRFLKQILTPAGVAVHSPLTRASPPPWTLTLPLPTPSNGEREQGKEIRREMEGEPIDCNQ